MFMAKTKPTNLAPHLQSFASHDLCDFSILRKQHVKSFLESVNLELLVDIVHIDGLARFTTDTGGPGAGASRRNNFHHVRHLWTRVSVMRESEGIINKQKKLNKHALVEQSKASSTTHTSVLKKKGQGNTAIINK
jgi:hypothetical protein